MTEIKREKVLAKIKALLSKTVENGCTEHEAMAALDVARGLMDSYEVTPEDLQDIKRETADLLRADIDSLGIKTMLARAISEFCDCKVWKSGKEVVYCGLPADVELAKWLTESLHTFVKAELKKHNAKFVVVGFSGPEKRRIQNGFTMGCCHRISERLDALTRKSRSRRTSNSTALVVAKGALIASKMAATGIHFGKARRTSRRVNHDSYGAGKAAGDKASFGRPVGGSSGLLK